MNQREEDIFKQNKIISGFDKFLSKLVLYTILFLEKISKGRFNSIFSKIKKNSEVFNNVIGLTVFNAIGGLLIIATQIKLANSLGPTSYGLYSYCLAIGEVGCVIVRYGRSKTMLRDLVQYPTNRNVLISSTFCSGLINLVLFLAVVLLLNKVLDIPLTPGCILLIVAPCLISLDFQPVYESIRKMSWQSIYNLIQKIIFVSLIWVALFFSFDLSIEYLGCVTFLSWIIVIVGQFREITKLYNINIVNDFSITQIVSLYKSNFIIALSSFFGILYQPVLRMILNHFEGSTSVGVFSAGFQILIIAQFILVQISRVGNPIMAEMGKKDCSNIKRKKTVQKYLLVMVSSVVPFFIILFFFSKEIVDIFFSKQYRELESILPMFAIYLLVQSVVLVLEQFLISMRKDRLYFSIYIFGSIITFVSAIVLVPLYSIYGAVIALCISMVLMSICYCFSFYLVINKFK